MTHLNVYISLCYSFHCLPYEYNTTGRGFEMSSYCMYAPQHELFYPCKLIEKKSYRTSYPLMGKSLFRGRKIYVIANINFNDSQYHSIIGMLNTGVYFLRTMQLLYILYFKLSFPFCNWNLIMTFNTTILNVVLRNINYYHEVEINF